MNGKDMLRQHMKEQDKSMAEKRRDKANLLKGDFGADARAF